MNTKSFHYIVSVTPSEDGSAIFEIVGGGLEDDAFPEGTVLNNETGEWESCYNEENSELEDVYSSTLLFLINKAHEKAGA